MVPVFVPEGPSGVVGFLGESLAALCFEEGCEKFVLKFPQKVLSSFLTSFSIVQHLSTKTETEVYEDVCRSGCAVRHPRTTHSTRRRNGS